MLRNYFQVTKPGIIFANMISVTGGFLLAAKGHADTALLPTMAGISLVMASGCVLNNCLDRDVDRMMMRTCNRVLAKGLMSPTTAVCYASALGVIGMALLASTTNMLCVAIVFTGFLIYVGAYSLYLKRKSVHAPLVGSLAGATPPLAGYCAVTGQFDMGAMILFSIFALWQIPHFYAVAIYRLEDYAAAAIPVLPLRCGVPSAQRYIIAYIFAFIAASLMLTFTGYTGYGFLVIALGLGLVWLSGAFVAYKVSNVRLWARRLFVCSIVVIVAQSAMMSIDSAGSVISHGALVHAVLFDLPHRLAEHI
ncbi:MAG: heme o synthase [Gammaproteobacteria bacterium]|jgi:protoheme IX farnesyltransferase